MKDYIKLVIIALVFSFGGTLIKFSRLMVSPEVLSFLRFSIGVVILYILIKKSSGKVKWHLLNKTIWIGAVGKSLHYMMENYGVLQGFSYGNIIVWPVQSVIVVLISVFFFKEKVSKQKGFAMVLCILGVAVISWNGVPLDVFLGKNYYLTLIFVVSGAGSAIFTCIQKKLVGQMESKEAYLSAFVIASGITFLPVPAAGSMTGEFHWSAVICILILGLITGVSFLVIADVMKTIPLYMVAIMQSITVIFSLVWAVVFFQEPFTRYTIGGTVLFIIGLIFINLRITSKKEEILAG